MNLPYSEGYEKSVLSSILQEPELLSEAQELGITAQSFYNTAEATLWRLICERVAKGKTLELIGLTQDILDTSTMEKLGGPSRLTEIYGYASTSAHFQQHITELKQKHALREAYKLAATIASKVQSNADVEEVTSLLGQPVTAVHELLQGEVQNFSVIGACDRLEQWLAALMTGAEAPSMQTGIIGLDALYGGLLKPSYTIISAVPGTGKTTMCIDMMHGFNTRGRRGGFFSLEMTERQLMHRLLIRASGLEGWKIGNPQSYTLTKEELQHIQATLAEIKQADFFIHDEPRLHIDKLCTIARKEHKRSKLDYIMVDYAQLMKGDRPKGDSQEREYADISNKLQGLMKELGCSVVLISQVTKDSRTGAMNTKGGKVFTDDADVWLHIGDDTDIAVAKCRHRGHTGKTLAMKLDKVHQRFVGNGYQQQL